MYSRLLILLLAFTGIGIQATAQLYPFVNYTPRDGLVGNKIRFISQDSKGKLYFGTTSGLSVYDGSRFSNYSTENGLAHNQVNGIEEAGDDSVLVILNAHKLQYIRNGRIGDIQLKGAACPVINQLIKCSNGGRYAIADEGLYSFGNGLFSAIDLKGLPVAGASKNLSHATELDSFLFINMDVFNPAYHSPKLFIAYNYHTGKVFSTAALPDIYYSVKTAKNELLLATSKGIFMLDRLALKQGELKLMQPTKPFTGLANTITDYLYLDHEQNLWLSGSTAVLKIAVDGSRQIFSQQNGLPDNKASCIFQDRDGIMWIGSDLTGAAKLVDQSIEFYKEYKPGFFAYDIFATANSDSVWLYDYNNRRVMLVQNNNVREFSPAGNQSLYWVIGNKQKTYAVSANSIYNLHTLANGTYSVSRLYNNPQKTQTLGHPIMDRNGNLISVGTTVTVMIPGHKSINQQLDYLADNAVLTKDDLLYVMTRTMNMYIYKIHLSDLEHYLELLQHYNWTANNIEPRSLAIDSSGKIWIGTRQKGLFSYILDNGHLKLIRQFSTKDGLTDNFVKQLHCDAAGNIWAGTPTGLDKISTHNDSSGIENVTKAANMYLDVQKITSDKNGVIWVVATSGLLKIYPAGKQLPGIVPSILFTKIFAANHEISLQEAASLKYSQNNISFHVAVPSFFDEKKTLFSYRLETQGSGSWTEPSPRSDISFLNLPPGHYELKVRASSSRYAPVETSYAFNIMTPWWQRWWFRVIEFLSILGLLLFFSRLYYRSKLQQQRLSLEKKQAIEKERTRIATDMHDDMGAGLSRIKVLSETISFENQKGIVNPTHLQKISAYSEEMMDKMGEIVWALNQRNDSFNDLLGYTRSYAVEYLTGHDINCAFHAPAQTTEAFVSGEVRRNVFLSVKEALHNIVKHAAASSVDISITTGTTLSVVIHDNGKGIDLQQLRKFGNGLNNIRKRMMEIGGSAEFRNESGTQVLLKVPL